VLTATIMASTRLDLGRLELVSTTSALQMQLSNSAQFAPPVRDETDMNTQLTVQTIIQDCRRGSWVYAASNYRLVIWMGVEDGVTACSRQEITEAVATAVGDAAVRPGSIRRHQMQSG